MRACHYQTASVETRQAVRMAPSLQLRVEDLHIQAATMSGPQKLALNGFKLHVYCSRLTRTKVGGGFNDVLDTLVK